MNFPFDNRIFAYAATAAWLSLAVPSTLIAEPEEIPSRQPATTWPEALILPWQTLNIDHDQLAKAAKGLAISQRELAEMSATNIIPLSEVARPSAALDLNSERVFTRILSGGLKDPSLFTKPLVAITPVWASAQSRQILMLIVSTSDGNIILGSSHRVVSAEAWRNNITRGTTPNVFSPMVRGMWEEISAKSLRVPNPDLAVGLSVGAVSFTKNEMERNALNLLLASEHLAGFTIVNPLGAEILAGVHRSWNAGGVLRKPNRILTMTWLYKKPASRMNAGPLELSLDIKAADGVFAQSLPWSVNETAVLDINNDNQLKIGITQKLREHLDAEQKSLARAENPLAVKKHGAWLYLDKGRAWGLRMNDRLVISDGSQTVKGHIVGYFGPEMQLKSPRGWPINEGAILFVRKGQATSQVGQEFIYDKMMVPTPWPPQNTAVK